MANAPMSDTGRKLLSFIKPRELTVGKRRYRLVPIEPEDEADPQVSAAEFLTPRELQIVALVADGKVNKQIADVLRISEWTVSTHLRRIFAKLGVDTRAAMVSRCYGITVKD
jgi:DNA-binding CsgD family transcriptional regulator